MADVILYLRIETELVMDAVGEINAIFVGLAKRHGAEFRRLERRIETVLENFADLRFGDEPLGDGIFVMTPPREFTQIIEQARRLAILPASLP